MAVIHYKTAFFVASSQNQNQNHPSGHLRGCAALWSAEEMLYGQRQRVDVPIHARTAHDGFPQKRLEEDLC